MVLEWLGGRDSVGALFVRLRILAACCYEPKWLPGLIIEMVRALTVTFEQRLQIVEALSRPGFSYSGG